MKKNNYKQNFSDYLNQYMKDHDLNNNDLIYDLEGEGIYVSSRAVSTWRKAEKCPDNIKTLIHICNLLNISLDELFQSEIKTYQERHLSKTELLSDSAKKTLELLIQNHSALFYKLLLNKNDWTCNFAQPLTYNQAAAEYENKLKNIFIQARLNDFLLQSNKEELFNYINVKILPALENEETKLYPHCEENVRYYAEIESTNITLEELDSSSLTENTVNTQNDISFDFLQCDFPVTEKKNFLDKLNNEVDQLIENNFRELFDANILSRESIHKTITEFVDVSADQRIEDCIMDFIKISFSLNLTKTEKIEFLKNQYIQKIEKEYEENN